MRMLNAACQKKEIINFDLYLYINLDKSRGLLKRISSSSSSSIQHSISRDRVIWQPSIQACVLVTSSQ